MECNHQVGQASPFGTPRGAGSQTPLVGHNTIAGTGQGTDRGVGQGQLLEMGAPSVGWSPGNLKYAGFNLKQFVPPPPGQGQVNTPRGVTLAVVADGPGQSVRGRLFQVTTAPVGSNSTQALQRMTVQYTPATNAASTQLCAEPEEPLGLGWIEHGRFLLPGAPRVEINDEVVISPGWGERHRHATEQAEGRVYLYRRSW